MDDYNNNELINDLSMDEMESFEPLDDAAGKYKLRILNGKASKDGRGINVNMVIVQADPQPRDINNKKNQGTVQNAIGTEISYYVATKFTNDDGTPRLGAQMMKQNNWDFHQALGMIKNGKVPAKFEIENYIDKELWAIVDTVPDSRGVLRSQIVSKGFLKPQGTN